MRRAILTVFCWIVAIVPSSADAQGFGLAPGDRIRATVEARAPQEFSVVAVMPETLQVRRPNAAQDELLPLSTVRKLEVYRGERPRGETFIRRLGKGAAIGALAGGLLIAVIDDDDFFADSAGEKFVIGGLVGGAVGGGIGALAGLGGGRGRWETVRPK